MNNLQDINTVPIFLWFILGGILLIQASFVFLDASKRGENKWLWGIFALLNTPSNLLVYLLVTRVIVKQKKCPSCLCMVNKKSLYCPQCGEPFSKSLPKKEK